MGENKNLVPCLNLQRQKQKAKKKKKYKPYFDNIERKIIQIKDCPK